MRPAHVALALLINVVWGFTFVAAKAGVSVFPPIWFSGLRFVLIALLLAPWIRPLGPRFRTVLPVALLAGALHYSCMYAGLSLAGQVSSVSIAAQLGTPFSMLLAVVFLGERIRWRRTLGAILAFGGVVVFGFDPAAMDHTQGLLLVVLAAALMAAALVLMRRLEGVGVLELQGWIAVISAPPLLALSLLIEHGQLEATLDPSWIGMGAVAFTAVGASILGQGGVLFAVVIYGDRLSARFLIGGTLTLIGVTIITLRNPPAASPRTGEDKHA
jgi:O-acetylserine/cysteine efflux transporter